MKMKAVVKHETSFERFRLLPQNKSWKRSNKNTDISTLRWAVLGNISYKTWLLFTD